jgi:hypothetical protein
LFVFIVFSLIVKIPWIYWAHVDSKQLLAGPLPRDILARRTFLIRRFEQGRFDPANMPSFLEDLFQGEWAIGSCSMTAAALTNIALLAPETKEESLKAIDGLAKLVLSKRFRKFDSDKWGEDPLETLASQNGHIGYLAHTNLILGAYRLLGGAEKYDQLHKDISYALFRRISNAEYPYLETYPGEIYTADNTALYASLKVYDITAGEDHSEIYERFVDYSKKHVVDSETGLLRFWVNQNGRGFGTPRGSGVGWNSFYLPFFAPEFASNQYKNAKTALGAALWFGAYAFREYPHGISGFGDVDSGPVVFGLSTSGTGFFIAGARREKDQQTLQGLLLTAESAGFTVQTKNGRSYLLAPVVGDAILLAMKTATHWDNRFIQNMD